MKNELTPKQQRFVNEYLIDLNAKQAAIRAGYSPISAEFQGSKLLAMSKVSQEIAKKQANLAKKFEIKKEDLAQDLLDIKESCKKDLPPTAVKAIEVLNKMFGFDAPTKIEHSGDLNINLSIPGLTALDDEPEE